MNHHCHRMCNFHKMKKLISGILIGFGFGVLLVLFLPITAWLTIIGIALIVAGIKFLFKD